MKVDIIKSWSRRAGFFALLALCVTSTLSACSSGSSSSNRSGAGEAGDNNSAGDSGMLGSAGAPTAGSSGTGEAGAAPIPPGDLACNTNQDCKGDRPVCDPIKGCVACIYDWDCPAGDRCDANQCFQKQRCSATSKCTDPARRVCDPVGNVCVACRADDDCAKGQRCDANRCEAIEKCTNSRDCTGGKVCNSTAGVCVACVVNGDCGAGNACFANRCVPTCSSDKACLGIGLLCDKQAARCVECLSHADCPSDYFCGEDGACQKDVCKAGTSRCDDTHTLQTCTDAGDRYVASACNAATCIEQGDTATCTPWVCTPDQAACSDDAGSVLTCDDTGLKVANTEPCGMGLLCVGGTCKQVVCAPNQGSCNGQELDHCSADGTTNNKLQTCNATYKCDADKLTCDAPKCTAGQPVCDGNLLTTCAADGSGPTPGGSACPTGQTCYGAQCLPIVCTGSFQCDANGTLYKCNNQGTSKTPTNYCSAAVLCDATAGKCITPKCTPGAFVCNGNVATRCKADGSDYESGGTDCSAQNQVCDGGGCLPKACTPNAYFCQAGNVEHCSTTGSTYTLSDTCSVSEYCTDGSAYCQIDKCTANGPVCSGNVATTCAADGSGPVAGGTDCAATNQLCVGGACKPIVCTPGSYSCQGEAVYQCTSNGTGTVLSATCLSSQFCDSAGDVPACVSDICVAGKLGCNGEVISTCATNGGSWTNPATNCATTNQVCVLGGTCAAQEQAVQGSALSSAQYANTSALAGFRALTTRKLTQIEVYASVAGLQKFTWVVYQKRSASSTYDLVYQKVSALSAPTAGFIASGALDYTFSAGKSYAIGVHIAGPATLYYYYYSQPLTGSFVQSPLALTYTDGAQPSASISPSSGYAVNLRLTTTLP